jgi:hypothetical protein
VLLYLWIYCLVYTLNCLHRHGPAVQPGLQSNRTFSFYKSSHAPINSFPNLDSRALHVVKIAPCLLSHNTFVVSLPTSCSTIHPRSTTSLSFLVLLLRILYPCTSDYGPETGSNFMQQWTAHSTTLSCANIERQSLLRVPVGHATRFSPQSVSSPE